MKYLQMLNLTLAAIAATFAVVLAVVAILYGVHVDQSTAVARGLPGLLKLVGLFSICTVAAAAAWWSRRQLKPWATPMQAASVFALTLCGWGIATLLGLNG